MVYIQVIAPVGLYKPGIYAYKAEDLTAAEKRFFDDRRSVSNVWMERFGHVSKLKDDGWWDGLSKKEMAEFAWIKLRAQLVF